jgi:hypothetical protein
MLHQSFYFEAAAGCPSFLKNLNASRLVKKWRFTPVVFGNFCSLWETPPARQAIIPNRKPVVSPPLDEASVGANQSQLFAAV